MPTENDPKTVHLMQSPAEAEQPATEETVAPAPNGGDDAAQAQLDDRDENTSSESTDTEATPPSSKPSGKTEEPDPQANRRKLIEALSREAPPPKANATDEEETDEETPSDTETPPAATESKDEPKPEAKTPDADDLTKPVSNDDIRRMKPGEARRKINKLLDYKIAAVPKVQMAEEIMALCEKNQFTPADYKAWVSLGIGLQSGDPRAAAHIAGIIKSSGLAPEEPAAAQPPPWTDADEEWLKGLERASEVSPETAAELRRRLTAKTTKPPAATPPAPAPTAQRQPPQMADPHQAALAQSASRAEQAIDRAAQALEKRIGAARFEEIKKDISTEMAAHRGAHPDAWPALFNAAVEKVLAKATRVAPVTPALRPGTGTPTGVKPTFKSERERVLHQFT